MGGVSRVACVLSDYLQHTHDITIYSTLSNYSYYQTRASMYFARKKKRFITLVRKSTAKTKFLFFKKETDPIFVGKEEVAELLEYIEKEQTEVVILTSRSISYARIIREKFPHVKLIGWVHNNASVYLEQYYLGIRTYFIESLSALDRLVVLTQSDKQTFSFYMDHVICIYNPLTLENEKGVSHLKNKTISFVGRLDFQHKGIDYLVQAARALPEGWRIKIAGTGAKGEVKKFYQLQKKYQLAEKLIMEGQKNDDELKRHYLNSSMYLMTSRWEGMPLVLAEAMSFGLPILAFDQTGANEVLDNGKYGILVENGNVPELVEQMLGLIEDIEKRLEYQKRSLERLEKFKIECIVQQWLTICE